VVDHVRVGGGEALDDRRRAVARGVVDDDELVVDPGLLERRGRLLDRAGDRPGLVVRGDDDRELQAATDQASTFCS
jgi:hypothetical protein